MNRAIDFLMFLVVGAFCFMFWSGAYALAKKIGSRQRAPAPVESRLDQLEQRVLRLERRVSLKEGDSLEDAMLSLR